MCAHILHLSQAYNHIRSRLPFAGQDEISKRAFFTEAILQLTSEKESAGSLEFLEKTHVSKELAYNVENASGRMRTGRLQRIEL